MPTSPQGLTEGQQSPASVALQERLEETVKGIFLAVALGHLTPPAVEPTLRTSYCIPTPADRRRERIRVEWLFPCPGLSSRWAKPLTTRAIANATLSPGAAGPFAGIAIMLRVYHVMSPCRFVGLLSSFTLFFFHLPTADKTSSYGADLLGPLRGSIDGGIDIRDANRTCGAKSLLIWLRLLGHHVEYDELMERVPIGNEGTSLAQLHQAAQQWTDRAELLKVRSGDLDQLQLPAIAHGLFGSGTMSSSSKSHLGLWSFSIPAPERRRRLAWSVLRSFRRVLFWRRGSL